MPLPGLGQARRDPSSAAGTSPKCRSPDPERRLGAAASTAVPIALANTPRRYGVVALALHWLMAALLVALVALGVIMVDLPDAGFDTRKIMLILWHKQLGVAAFALVSARWLWRLGNPLPALAGGLPAWQRFAARFVHLCLYGLMVGLPASGWVMSSAAAIPVSFLGLF